MYMQYAHTILSLPRLETTCRVDGTISASLESTPKYRDSVTNPVGSMGHLGSLGFFDICVFLVLSDTWFSAWHVSHTAGFPVSHLEEPVEGAVWRGDGNFEDNESGKEPDEATGNEIYLPKPSVPCAD